MRGATPMMAQYHRLKRQNPDSILFFRLGDFYEMFFEDAQLGSKELGITLTARDAGKGNRAPMCGVPYHAVDEYIKTLVEKGYKVSLCEQIQDPQEAKGLVERDVVRVITPGTYWEGADDTAPSYICSLYPKPEDEGVVGFTAADLSTGEVLLSSFENAGQAGAFSAVLEEIAKFDPKEVLLQKDIPGKYKEAVNLWKAHLTLSPESFEGEKDAILSVYGQDTLDDLSSKTTHEAIRALNGLLAYLFGTQKVKLGHLKTPVLYLDEGFLEMDPSTLRNLEISQRISGEKEGSLAWALDKTVTTMGSRRLKAWLKRPLLNIEKIISRQDAVSYFVEEGAIRTNLRSSMSKIRDLERLVTKLSFGTCGPRDLIGLASSLEKVPDIKKEIPKDVPALILSIGERLDPQDDLVMAIRETVVENPPISATEGGLIKEGYSEEIDSLRDLSHGGKEWIRKFEEQERLNTGIKSLKVGYNRVFGYYIEVTKANIENVPENYVRKQTLSASERYITDELRVQEAQILGAEEKLNKEEYRIFVSLRDHAAKMIKKIQETADALSDLDVLLSFSEAAYFGDYRRPKLFSDGITLNIEEGRHPVLETILPPGDYIPNDLFLNDKRSTLIITGPNMGGKSTFCRQTALLTVMAQAGSFIPCKKCTLSLVDKIFARVGAYDDLFTGRSTFMVEMSEVSEIVGKATAKSLVILDEIGRGTSTFDGLAVAWAVVEHLFKLGSRNLVATHYRELTLLSDLRSGIANYHVTLKKDGDSIIFLRKVVPGVAEGSFGIEVAKMAGLPHDITQKAQEILEGLETEARKGGNRRAGILGQIAKRSVGIPGQESLFSNPPSTIKDWEKAALNLIEKIEPNLLTPLEALNKIYEIKKVLDVKE